VLRHFTSGNGQITVSQALRYNDRITGSENDSDVIRIGVREPIDRDPAINAVLINRRQIGVDDLPNVSDGTGGAGKVAEIIVGGILVDEARDIRHLSYLHCCRDTGVKGRRVRFDRLRRQPGNGIGFRDILLAPPDVAFEPAERNVAIEERFRALSTGGQFCHRNKATRWSACVSAATWLAGLRRALIVARLEEIGHVSAPVSRLVETIVSQPDSGSVPILQT
jgi:hypothetical protein